MPRSGILHRLEGSARAHDPRAPRIVSHTLASARESAPGASRAVGAPRAGSPRNPAQDRPTPGTKRLPCPRPEPTTADENLGTLAGRGEEAPAPGRRTTGAAARSGRAGEGPRGERDRVPARPL